MTDDIQQKIEYYLNQPYTFQVETHEEDGGTYYSIRVLELEGCITTGDTLEEVGRDIKMRCGNGFSSTSTWKGYSRTIKVERLQRKSNVAYAPSLHEALMLRASEEGVSLNQ
jgi:hypothetical protein